jgi:hypothetical protein
MDGWLFALSSKVDFLGKVNLRRLEEMREAAMQVSWKNIQMKDREGQVLTMACTCVICEQMVANEAGEE